MPLYHLAFCLTAMEHDPTLEFDPKVKFVVEKSMQLWRNKYLKNGFISGVPGWYISNSFSLSSLWLCTSLHSSPLAHPLLSSRFGINQISRMFTDWDFTDNTVSAMGRDKDKTLQDAPHAVSLPFSFFSFFSLFSFFSFFSFFLSFLFRFLFFFFLLFWCDLIN
jgi:hypothetical protein